MWFRQKQTGKIISVMLPQVIIQYPVFSKLTTPPMVVYLMLYMSWFQALWELAENLGEVRRVGMEQEDISRLPIHTYQPSASGNNGDNKTDCLVCMSEFEAGEQLRTLPCCHIYHVTCIDEWLRVSKLSKR